MYLNPESTFSLMGFLDDVKRLTELRVKLMNETANRAPSLIKAIEDRNSEGYVGLIAEYKRVSPSGVIRLDLDAYGYFSQVSPYATGFSVLTEPFFFTGHPLFIRIASMFNKPILYKDFVIHESQVEEAYSNGASAILIIYRLLNGNIGWLVDAARRRGLEPLIEVDNVKDAADAAKDYPEFMIGVNSRDLGDLSISLERSIDIIRAIRGRGVLVIAESGVRGKSDAEVLAKEGVNAILVGTALMRNPTLAKELHEVRVG
ncbi:indole-3-glycerol-phosphate synthase [Caldivirga sp.]|uniref:indole-3-glycerol-phosphate synthase n=1 Tax=Caldivirga sp. TaxID=2080243 RepID=UPI003D0AFE57